jgi:hypothetical protein
MYLQRPGYGKPIGKTDLLLYYFLIYIKHVKQTISVQNVPIY